MDNINIVHATSDTLIRVGLKSILFKGGGIDTLYHAENNQILFKTLTNKKPDLLIMNCDQSNSFSINDIKQVKQLHKKTKILVISTDKNPTYILSILELGVHGYLTRECDEGELINAIFAIANNEKFYCNKIINIILEKKLTTNDDCDPTSLSQRETEITTLIAKGMTNKEIAVKLFLSPHTINTHRKNIMKKLGVKSTSELVLYAVNVGLIYP
ncbi:response regulator transcription factor [Lutibacter sp.]|uniref:helix-turn-helix transcriptional regulator n=1 Tax=Lutibacter sp. TaxID=1925666 RepID=UPI0025BD7E51|nr:response regulator transcription factor [Lutibacter sp.]MCF6168191.1 response regulator transcription factor [Lutibacter sp.]